MLIQQSLLPCLLKGPADSQSEREGERRGEMIRSVKANLQSMLLADASSQTSQFPQDQETKGVRQFPACFTASDAFIFILLGRQHLVMKGSLYI